MDYGMAIGIGGCVSDTSLLRLIPKVDVLLSSPALDDVCSRFPYEQVREYARDYLEVLRKNVLTGKMASVPSVDEIAADILDGLDLGENYSLRRVINATGIVLHTNLGRAPLGEEVSRHVAEVAAGYSNLEYDLADGNRGSRYSHVERLLCKLSGAESAMVVNNNASAVLLVLDTLCRNKKVAISRGELVEIGGSFRVPDIMERGGAELLEVGTTNKTHPYDYERALGQGAEALLKVHASNFVMKGFTESVSAGDLAKMAHQHGAIAIFDAGSATLFPSELLGIPEAVDVRAAIRDGVDLACFSGDKLLGSAQAGIILGRKGLVDRLKRNPLSRALRIDKLSLAALEGTLQLCLTPKEAISRVPTLRMLAMSREDCADRAKLLLDAISSEGQGVDARLQDVEDEAGGGSLPGVTLPGCAVSLGAGDLGARGLERRLRQSAVPIVSRVHDGRVLLSARTIAEDEISLIASAVILAMTESPGNGWQGGGGYVTSQRGHINSQQ